MSDFPTHDGFLKELADRLARGDEAAFAELYDACADRMHRYLAARIGSRDLASDVLQTTFLRAVTSRRRFRGVENPIAYVFQIARNEAARHAKQHRRTTDLINVAEPFTQAAENSGDAEAIAAAIARLEPQDQELVELKVYGGLTFREIAAIVDRPPATVATRYRRALEHLRGTLTKEFR